MMCRILFLIFIQTAIYGSEVPNFKKIDKSRNVTFFLSTTKSGSNLVSASLSAITRKPISWLGWGNKIFDPSFEGRNNPSYNRLGLSFVSDKPLLYRTHYGLSKLMKVPSKLNKLIFVTRNPKELIYRKFFLQSPSLENPDSQFIEEFLDGYLQVFKVYNSWYPENRFIVFYEDFIDQDEVILLQVLEFMDEEPKFLDDFINNKQEYRIRLLNSYNQQHKDTAGGKSSIGKSKAIHYSKNASPEILTFIDEYIKRKAPNIWKQYLKRFQVSVEPETRLINL